MGCPRDVLEEQLNVSACIRERTHSAQGGLGVVGIQMAFKGMSTVKSPGGCRWREMGCKGRAVGTLHSKGEKGCKGLRNNRREGRAWSPGRDMLGGVVGEGKEGRGLGNMGSWSPRGAALQGGAHRLLAESWRPGREGDHRGRSQGAFRDPHGCCREP